MTPDLGIQRAAPLIDVALRSGVAALLGLATIYLLEGRPSRSSRFGVALALVTIVSALTDLPEPLTISPPLSQITGSAAIPLFWFFARAWFDDGFRLRIADGVLATAYVAASSLIALQDRGVAAPLRALDAVVYCGGAAFTLHTLYGAWRERASDLVESRRRARLAFVVVVTGMILWSIASEIVGRLAGAALLPALAANLGLLVGALGLSVILFGIRHPDMFPLVQVEAATGAAPPAPAAGESEPGDPADGRIAEALEQLMTHDRLYREPDLTIGGIAARLAVPEYRLRRVINGRFGYRNISDYLNGLRIAEVRDALCDPAQSQVPILTIAMDAGFGSLAVFNRAFKEREGMTPSSFRKQWREERAATD